MFSMAASLGFAAVCEFAFDSPLVPGILQFSHSPLLQATGSWTERLGLSSSASLS